MPNDVQPTPLFSNTHPLQAHRLAAAENGWPQIACREKKGCVGWPRMANDRPAILADKQWQNRYYTGTGIRVEGDLCVYDLDVSEAAIADEILDDLWEQDPDAYEGAIIRNSGGVSRAVIWRCRTAFGHRKTRQYTAHPEHLDALAAAQSLPETTDAEDAVKHEQVRAAYVLLDPQKVEFYGPASRGRLFQYEGKHSEGRMYHCEGDRWPWNTRLADVALMPSAYDKEDHQGELIDRADAILAAHLTLIPEAERPKGDVIYDLAPEMYFYPKGRERDTIENLTQGMEPGAEHGIRGCAAWARVSRSESNCKLFVTESGRIAITDWANDGVTHYMKNDAPASLDDETIAAALATVDEGEASNGDDSGGTAEDSPPSPDEGVHRRSELRHADLIGHSPSGKFIHRATRELWPSVTVDKRLPKVRLNAVGENGKAIKLPASTFIMKTAVVEQMSWIPGEGEIIEDAIVLEGGRQFKAGARVFNLYQAPAIISGDARRAGRWIDHIHMLYDAADAVRILRYFAFTAQFPGIKINHALLMGGAPGIGKDTIIAPLRHAVGSWNFAEVKPSDLFDRFNKWQRAVVLRINEMHDLGDENMFALYERMKVLTASPPEVLRVNEKHLGEYHIPNVIKVIGTTNYLQNGVYLPPEDRRTDVLWSPLRIEDKPADNYFDALHHWLDGEGDRHVATYLRGLDLKDFNPKAAPPKTEAFWSIVNANRSPTDSGLGDVIAAMSAATGGPPGIFMVGDLQAHALSACLTDTYDWLRDVRHRRQIPAALERHGYVEVPNMDATDRRWLIQGRKQLVYRHVDVAYRDAVTAIAARQKTTSWKK